MAQRVVASGKVRPSPRSKRKGASWPFAALGVVQVNKQDYAGSIASFQSALRISPGDYHSWVGLGESYHNSGRYIAATKAFQQAARVEAEAGAGAIEERWFAGYMLANVKRELGDYDEAVSGYDSVLRLRSGEFGVQMALVQTLVEGAWHCVETGFFGRAAELAARAISVAREMAQGRPDAFNVWKAVGDACSVPALATGDVEKIPLDELAELLETPSAGAAYDILTDVDGVGQSATGSLAQADEDAGPKTRVLEAAILAQKRAVDAAASDVHAQAVAWYNLGWTEHRAAEVASSDARLAAASDAATSSRLDKRARRFRRAAVRCFKRAIELEAGNSEFWNALGVATSQANARVAQHSFIRSLYLDDKNARVWTNLGALYVAQEDLQLANDAFARAQSTDPDYGPAWLGQGLLAAHLGDAAEARSLFTHAFEISGSSSSQLTQCRYAEASFDALVGRSSSDLGELLGPLFALRQVRAQAPGDVTHAHLAALLLERVGDHATAIEVLAEVCGAVEQDYEASESATALARFAQAKADLARVQLAAHDFDGAVESAETALQLAGDEDDDDGGGGSGGGLTPDARRRCRLSAHLTAGLGQHYAGATDGAIEMFRAALEESGGAADVVCLLAQVLWAKGGADERAVARAQVRESAHGTDGPHVPSAVLLGAVALLHGDDADVASTGAALRAARGRDGLTREQRQRIDELLAAGAALSPTPRDEATAAMAAVMLAPGSATAWSQLAGTAGADEARDGAYAAAMALVTARGNVPPAGPLSAEELGKAYAGADSPAHAQRGIVTAPWRPEGWQALRALAGPLLAAGGA